MTVSILQSFPLMKRRLCQSQLIDLWESQFPHQYRAPPLPTEAETGLVRSHSPTPI